MVTQNRLLLQKMPINAPQMAQTLHLKSEMDPLTFKYDHFELPLWHFGRQNLAEMYQKLQSSISQFHKLQRDRVLTFCYRYGYQLVIESNNSVK